jgi:DNA-binding NarL/FixJ family response regulator
MGAKHELGLFRKARIRLAGQLSRIRVLLADDHPGFTQIVETLLGSAYEVTGSVSNGRSLIDAAMKTQPDIIVTDISMPILNGIDAAIQLKNSSCKSKIVFLSVHSDPEFVETCLSIGALGYVIKTQMATELMPAIREALAGRVFVSPGLSHLN